MKTNFKYHLDVNFGRLRTAFFLLLRMPHKIKRLTALSRQPIIIGGCNRSGTSLMLSLLSCHPDVVGIGKETHGLCQRRTRKRTGFYSTVRMWRVYQWLGKIDIPPEAKRWAEKTPRNVYNYANLIHYFGPDVRILNMVRDGRDVVTSYYGNDDEHMVDPDYWSRFVSLGKEMESHPQVMTVHFEDLVREPIKMMKQICEHVGLDYVPEFESYPDSARVRNLGGLGKARPISPQSIGRWKKPEFEERVDEFMAHPKCRELLAHYGYL